MIRLEARLLTSVFGVLHYDYGPHLLGEPPLAVIADPRLPDGDGPPSGIEFDAIVF